MKAKKLISMLLATSMLAVTAVSAFAAAPADYDSKPYENVGYTSEDPDGEINLAVIANGKVDIGNAMYIKGSVYSNDTIYVLNGGGNKVDGLFISGIKGMWDYAEPLDGATDDIYRDGYIHVDADHNLTTNAYSTTLEYEGAILDENTSFDTVYTPYEIPEIENYVESLDANQYWPGMQTVSESTHYGTLSITGQGLLIDTSAGDVTIVVDNFNPGNAPEIFTTGGHKVKFYILNTTILDNFNVTIHDQDINVWELPGVYAGGYNYKEIPSWNPHNIVEDFFEGLGDPDAFELYVGQKGDSVVFNGMKFAGNIYSNADSVKVGGSARLKGTITSGATEFAIDGEGTYIQGKVVVPNAETLVGGAATILGQVVTNTLTSNGAGQIVYKADTAAVQTATPEPVVTPEPTAEPTPEPTLEPIPTGTPIDLTGVGYAYIFGYEPDLIKQVWVENAEEENGGHTAWNVEIRMAPQDSVTREQVAAMIMRLIDQKYDTKDAVYPVTDNIAEHAGTWYERGLAYIASTGAFDGVDKVYTGAVTRGEVAKLIAYGLNLSDTIETSFEDIADSPYKAYIEIMNAYGYMQGLSDTTFEPDRVMTRAEFCSMFNQIIDRQDALLVAADGTEVTPETYYFVDLDPNAWYTPVMLRATSAYDADGYVDIDTRLSNIRNTLDNYDSQKMF